MNYTNQDIDRYLKGECSVDESLEMIRFFQTEEGEKLLEIRLNADAETFMSNDKENNPTQPPIPFQRIAPKTVYRNQDRRIKWIFVAAASILLPVLISIAVYVYKADNIEPEYVEVCVPRGEKQQIFFQDGTHVWLGADSKLSFPKRFANDRREVKLNGEAYFEVESNSKRDFTVQLDQMHITVHGTGFNVKAYADSPEIITTLDHGSISVYSDFNNKEYKVEPGQQVSFNRENGRIHIRRMDDPRTNSAWRNGYIQFQNTTLRSVMAELSRQYDVNFQLVDKQLENTRFTISFNNQDLPSLLSELQLIAPVRFVIRNKDVEVYSIK